MQLFVSTTVWLEISYSLRLKGKNPNPTWTIHLVFYIFILNEKIINM